jgi:putative flippase GtrA
MTDGNKAQILTYGIIGAFSSLIHISSASIFVRFFYESLLFSNCVGFLTAFTFSYIFHSRLVFNVELSFKKAVKFFLVQCSSLILAIKAAELIQDYTLYFKIIFVACLLPLFTFFIHKLWTFTKC